MNIRKTSPEKADVGEKQNIFGGDFAEELNIDDCYELELLISDDSGDSAENEAEDEIFEIASYIKKHFTEELSVKDMAKRLGYTPNYFSMKYKRVTGKSFTETVNDARLEHAYHMLSCMDVSVNDVSEYVGYSSITYFSRIFKKKFGKTPREVKNKKTQ